MTSPQDTAARAVTGHGARQDPWELGTVLHILAATKPQLIVEIGSWAGGSLYAWASTGAHVIGVTLPETRPDLNPHGADMIWGDSTQPATQQELEAALAGRAPDFFFIDGDHSAGGAENDFRLAMTARARIIGFHDIRHPAFPGVRDVYEKACQGRRHMEIVNPHPPLASGGPDVIGTGLIWAGR